MTLQFDYIGTLFDDENDANKVTVALTMGCKALEKGYSAGIILMVNAVYLAPTNKLDGVDIGAPFKPAKDLLEAFIAKGGKILVCGPCVEHNNVDKESIDERFIMITADNVIDLLMAAKGSLQVT